MTEFTKIALDVFGGDNAPDVCLEGAELALCERDDIYLYMLGYSDTLSEFCASHDRCEMVKATEVIEMADHPTEAIRKKKDSTIVVGAKLLKEKTVDGFFSAGSTGACLAAATLITGRVKGVSRPAIASLLPAYEKPTLLLDVGANADCKPEYLAQFARMGTIYMQEFAGVEDPEVGLYNIGAEETKGNQIHIDFYNYLKENISNFKGNAEGKDVLFGKFDVVVTDGFTGNIALKTIEGTSAYMMKLLKEAMLSSIKSKIGALLMKSSLKQMKSKLDPDSVGGSQLLGVKGTVLIGHGSSNANAIKNGILTCADTVCRGIADKIEKSFSKE